MGEFREIFWHMLGMLINRVLTTPTFTISFQMAATIPPRTLPLKSRNRMQMFGGIYSTLPTVSPATEYGYTILDHKDVVGVPESGVGVGAVEVDPPRLVGAGGAEGDNLNNGP